MGVTRPIPVIQTRERPSINPRRLSSDRLDEGEDVAHGADPPDRFLADHDAPALLDLGDDPQPAERVDVEIREHGVGRHLLDRHFGDLRHDLHELRARFVS